MNSAELKYEGQKPALVLLHGWGMPSSVWTPVLADLDEHFSVTLLDLPGYAGDSAVDTLSADELIDQLIEQAPDNAIWCGWSLGGMLAARVAERAPDTVRGLITLCANSVFVESTEWPDAMSAQDFTAFEQAVGQAPTVALDRFISLEVKGSASFKQDRRTLKGLLNGSVPDASVLQTSLGLLKSLDVRQSIAQLQMPNLHLFGSNDALVPVGVAEQVAALNPFTQVVCIDGAGHVPFISHPTVFKEQLLCFTKQLKS